MCIRDRVKDIPNRLDYEQITIEAVIEQAIRTHPSISKSQLTFENSLEAIKIARSVRYPQTNLNLSYGFADLSRGSTHGGLEVGKFELGSRLLIGDFGASKYQIKAAKDRMSAAQASLANRKNIIALAAVESFVDVLEERLALDFGRIAYTDYRNIKLKLRETGLDSDADINQVIASKDSICATIASLKAEENRALNFYEAVLDYKPTDYFLVDPTMLPVELNLDVAIKNAMDKNPMFLQSRHSLNSAENSYRSTKKNSLPKIYADSSYKTQDQFSNNFGDSSSDEFFVGATFVIPITDGGRRKAQRSQARRNVTIAENSVEETRRALRQQISNLVFELGVAQDRITQLESAVEANRKAYEEMRDRLIVNGAVDSQNLINMLNQRNSLYQAQVQLNTQRYALILDSYSLKALQGPLVTDY